MQTKFIIKKVVIILTFTILLSTLTSCKNRNQDPISKSALKLNTYITITIYDKYDYSLIDNCFDLVDKYEQLFSKTISTSEVSKINSHGAGDITVSDDTASLISTGLYYSELSDGAFDITIEPLSTLWNFTSDDPKVPASDDIKNMKSLINYKNISVRNRIVTKDNSDTHIDLGAIAKGYIADRIKEYLVSEGVTSAIIDLGGNVLCIGKKPNGEDFKIGIQKPFADRNETMGALSIDDMSIVSSGIYERCFSEDGVLYHHLLNPLTGYPYDNGLISVTIISKNSVDGDALSTSCFALGLEEGMDLINSLEDTYAIFITDDYDLYYSDGFKDNISYSITQ